MKTALQVAELKSKEQNLVLQKWKNNSHKGTYLGGTGVGKTRVGVLVLMDSIISELDKTLVVVPTTNLRDNEWENEIVKWGATYIRDNIEIQCIQTAYKFEGRHYKLLIIDELHTALGQQYRNLLLNNTFDRILFLTATLDDDTKKEFAFEFAPVIHETSLKEALAMGIVSNFKIYNYGIDFIPSERRMYDEANNLFRLSASELGSGNVLPKAFSILKNKTRYSKGACSSAYNLITSMHKRIELVDTATMKLPKSMEIMDKFTDRKTIVFSQSIPFIEELKERWLRPEEMSIYHSKMTKKARIKALEHFTADGKILGTCKALNAGFDIPACDLGLCASGRSVPLDQIQRTGRIIRYEENKTAIFVNLYVNDTVDFNWVSSRTDNLPNVYWVTSLSAIQ